MPPDPAPGKSEAMDGHLAAAAGAVVAEMVAGGAVMDAPATGTSSTVLSVPPRHGKAAFNAAVVAHDEAVGMKVNQGVEPAQPVPLDARSPGQVGYEEYSRGWKGTWDTLYGDVKDQWERAAVAIRDHEVAKLRGELAIAEGRFQGAEVVVKTLTEERDAAVKRVEEWETLATQWRDQLGTASISASRYLRNVDRDGNNT